MESRIIKFRAWDSNTETMITEPAFINVGGDGTFQVFIESEPSSWLGKEDGVYLMQFTGLQDSKGVDIYEGDIVTIPTDKKGVVEWDSNWSRWAYRNNEGSLIGFSAAIGIEIIGNIYSTPELLTQ